MNTDSSAASVKIEIKKLTLNEHLNDKGNVSTSEGVNEKMQVFVYHNINHRFNVGKLDLNLHYIYFLLDLKKDDAVGFIYFYHPVNNSNHCELFAVYVDSPYRGCGYAMKMLKNAIEDCLQKGVTTFTARFADRNQARDGLFRFLKKYFYNKYPPIKADIYSDVLWSNY